MIKIKHSFSNSLEVDIEGHSGAAPMGEDLYCAGISVLTVALACALKDAKSQGYIEELSLDVREGDTHIKAIPKVGFEPIVQTIFTTIFNGYDAMSISFPDYVSFQPRGVETPDNSAVG